MITVARSSIFFLLLLLSGMNLDGHAGVIALEGNYQGKNLYVQNPFASAGVGFCVTEVTVNGDVTTDEINSSAFEIDLSILDLDIGDPIVVKVKHKDDCKPKVLNSEVLKPKSTYELVKVDINREDSLLNWTTKGETGQLPFIVEQYRWNKWVRVGEVPGKGSPEEHSYSYKITPHAGENRFRVKQCDYSGKCRPSKAATFHNTSGKEVDFSPKKVDDKIIFTQETMFEIYNEYANIVKKGYAKEVNVESLEGGTYYINYGNKSESFVKK